MHENRETSGVPRPERERDRSAKAPSHKADAHALEESDRTIVSMNETNKEERSSAEPGEKRVRAKEFNPTPIRHRAGNECPRRSYGSVRGAISDGRPYRVS